MQRYPGHVPAVMEVVHGENESVRPLKSRELDRQCKERTHMTLESAIHDSVVHKHIQEHWSRPCFKRKSRSWKPGLCESTNAWPLAGASHDRLGF